jgi:uncharacterized membrane protein
MESVILVSLLAMLLLGVGDVFSKLATQKLDIYEVLIIRTLIIAVILLGAEYYFNGRIALNIPALGYGFSIGLIGYVGLRSLMKSLQKGKLGIVSPAFSLRLVFSVLAGVLLLGDLISLNQILFMLLIFIGVIAISVDLKHLSGLNGDLIKEPGLVHALIAAIVIGSVVPFFGKVVIENGPYIGTLVIEVAIATGALIEVLSRKDSFKNTFKDFFSNVWLILSLGVIITFANMTMNYAYSLGSESITSALIGASSLITTVLGAIFFKERLKSVQYFAILIIIVGVVGLSFI